MANLEHVSDTEVVFEFDQDARPMWAVRFSPKRSYAQAVKGKGYRSFEAAGNKGMCMSMVCNWVKKAIGHGGSIASLEQLGTLKNVAIAHSAYRKFNVDVVDAYGLKETDLDGADLNEPISDHVDTILSWPKDVTEQAYFVLYLEPNGPRAGHVVGIKSGPTAWSYFDPNFGLYKFDSRDRLLVVLRNVVSEHLMILDQIGGGTWYLNELALRQ